MSTPGSRQNRRIESLLLVLVAGIAIGSTVVMVGLGFYKPETIVDVLFHPYRPLVFLTGVLCLTAPLVYMTQRHATVAAWDISVTVLLTNVHYVFFNAVTLPFGPAWDVKDNWTLYLLCAFVGFLFEEQLNSAASLVLIAPVFLLPKLLMAVFSITTFSGRSGADRWLTGGWSTAAFGMVGAAVALTLTSLLRAWRWPGRRPWL